MTPEPSESWPNKVGRAVGDMWRGLWGSPTTPAPETKESEPMQPTAPADTPTPAPALATVDNAGLRMLLKEIGTNLWRLKNKMCPPGRSEPPDELASMYRHVDSMWEALREAGVQIQDHTGKAFDSGMPIVCLAFQPTPGLKREIIVETIKPSIFLNNQRIQTGEVIVGAPIAIASEPEALAKEPLANASGSDGDAKEPVADASGSDGDAKEPLANASGSDGDAKDAPSLAASEPEALAKDVPTLANASGSESHGEPKP